MISNAGITSPLSPGKGDGMTQMEFEARSAPELVAKMLQSNADQFKLVVADLQSSMVDSVVTCARGSSDHAATYAKYLIETQLGLNVSSQGPSIASVYGVSTNMKQTLFLAISQSGKSPDLIAAADLARAAGARVVAIVNDETSPLAQKAHFVLPLCAGPEISVAATKTYIASLAVVAGLVSAWAMERKTSDASDLADGLVKLPEQLASALSCDWSSAIPAFRDANNMIVLGRGLGLGITFEAALKFKETCRLHAEGFSAAEFKHGPLALVDKDFPVLVFRQDDVATGITGGMIAEMRALGANVFVAEIQSSGDASGHLPVVAGVHPALIPITMVQSFYLLVNAVSLARGLNPDKPPHLNKVTETH